MSIRMRGVMLMPTIIFGRLTGILTSPCPAPV